MITWSEGDIIGDPIVLSEEQGLQLQVVTTELG